MTVVRTPMRWLFGALVVSSMAVLFLPTGGGASVIPDKVVHVLIFTALAGTGRLAAIWFGPLVAGLLAYAVLSEIVQGALPTGRSADWRDALADAIGVVLGLLFAQMILLLSARIGPYRAGRSRDADMPEHRR